MAMRVGKAESNGVPGKRDAFHVAAVLVRTWDNLKPGDSVVFDGYDFTRVAKSDPENRHGIVDPFLKELDIDDLFWVLLEPELVDKLNHNFEIQIPGRPDYNYRDAVDAFEPTDDDDECRQMGCS